MIARIESVTVFSSETRLVKVEVNLLPGQMHMHIMGLADHAVRESRERIRSAIVNSGFHFPIKCIVVNLYPNDLPKMGALCEFAIATSILIASGQLPAEPFRNSLLLGSLLLDGSIADARGMLNGAIYARQKGIKRVLVAEENSAELRYIDGVDLFTFSNLNQLGDYCQNSMKPRTSLPFKPETGTGAINMAEIKGMLQAKKAIAYALIGGHHTLLIGPPGSGKTMLCKAAKGLLPDLTLQESLELSQLYSATGLNRNKLVKVRPFRSPHHTSSEIALVGGGANPRPGEISLAHRGILFLDELLEFQTNTLQSLREPLQEGCVMISRTQKTVSFLADFTLLAAANPCRCGYRFVVDQLCTCRKEKDRRILDKIIGPFLDRVTLEVEADTGSNIFSESEEKDSAWWRARVNTAHQRMQKRNGGLLNNRLGYEAVQRLLVDYPAWQKHVKTLAQKLTLSNRSVLNSLRLAVTIMDFNFDEGITPEHLNEAFSYRLFSQVAGEFKKVA